MAYPGNFVCAIYWVYIYIYNKKCMNYPELIISASSKRYAGNGTVPKQLIPRVPWFGNSPSLQCAFTKDPITDALNRILGMQKLQFRSELRLGSWEKCQKNEHMPGDSKLGWISDPFKGLSDLQQGDKKVTLNHLLVGFLSVSN